MSAIATEHADPGPGQLQDTCHDMREPIACVLALAAAALAEPELPAAARGRLDEIVAQAEWLAEIIRLRLPGNGAAAKSAGRSDLVRIINEAAAAERLTCSTELNVVWPGEPVLLPLDRVILRRMIANLLSNATRAAGASGTVRIEIERHDGRAVVVVEDDGPGFGAIQPGSGLGLQAVARSAIAHGGRLECRHSVLGGVRVTLWLPLLNPVGPADAELQKDRWCGGQRACRGGADGSADGSAGWLRQRR